MTVGLLSATLSRQIGSADIKVPQATWHVPSRVMFEHTTGEEGDAPLSEEQRSVSLKVMLEHTPFGTVDKLLEAGLKHLTGDHGTCLLLFACDAKQFDISSDANDILLPLPSDDLSTADAPTPMAHEVSLRAFLEVLYYVRGFPRTCPVTRAQRLACPCPASCL